MTPYSCPGRKEKYCTYFAELIVKIVLLNDEQVAHPQGKHLHNNLFFLELVLIYLNYKAAGRLNQWGQKREENTFEGFQIRIFNNITKQAAAELCQVGQARVVQKFY